MTSSALVVCELVSHALWGSVARGALRLPTKAMVVAVWRVVVAFESLGAFFVAP